MVLQLSYKTTATVPLEVEGVTPLAVRGMSLAEVQQMTVFLGNQKAQLGDFFDVSGDPSDARMEWQGDLSGVHWIGAKMTEGNLVIHGNAGRHLGSEMRGGTIDVHGDAGDWVGGEMHGGLVHVRGRAGHLVGAAYRGSARGMTEGTILIDGDVGNELGHTLRRGMIAVAGRVGDLAGFNMLAGSILTFGEVGIRHGAGMRRGTLGCFGKEAPQLLPSFRYACRFSPDVFRLIFAYLRRHHFPFDESLVGACFDLYNGDMIEGGRGEVLLRVE